LHKFGSFLVWIGLILSAGGVVFGFGAMFIDADHQAVNLLGLVPLGFMALLCGVVMVLFSHPKKTTPGEGSHREPE
jgi:hypothetical protein